MHVCISCAFLVYWEARSGHWLPWNWGYEQLYAIMLVLGITPRSLGRGTSALHSELSLQPKFLLIILLFNTTFCFYCFTPLWVVKLVSLLCLTDFTHHGATKIHPHWPVLPVFWRLHNTVLRMQGIYCLSIGFVDECFSDFFCLGMVNHPACYELDIPSWVSTFNWVTWRKYTC